MKESEKVINWIRQYFEENGKGCMRLSVFLVDVIPQ